MSPFGKFSVSCAQLWRPGRSPLAVRRPVGSSLRRSNTHTGARGSLSGAQAMMESEWLEGIVSLQEGEG